MRRYHVLARHWVCHWNCRAIRVGATNQNVFVVAIRIQLACREMTALLKGPKPYPIPDACDRGGLDGYVESGPICPAKTQATWRILNGELAYRLKVVGPGPDTPKKFSIADNPSKNQKR
ncbi:hypothetical protein MCOR25_011192 [Pyricularia grisea]|nr:hypothetical protein MCOR25_011192 [Pyricularia grisea]